MLFNDIINGQIENINIDTYAGKALIACRTKMKGIFGDNGLITLNLIAFMEFIRCHDILASNGYFITEDNKEEIYIDILGKEDPKLLEVLQQYIDLSDSFDKVLTEIERYKKVVQAVQECLPDDVEKINDAVKEYLEQ